MNERWYLHTKKADFNEIGRKYHISTIIAKIIRNRDVVGDEAIQNYLHPKTEFMDSPWLFKDMDAAVDLLNIKIDSEMKIRVIGDYDVDGICAGYMLLRGLRELGANVDLVVPHRIEDGYGINERLIEKAYDDGIDTIVTCDNGIAAIEPIKRAKELGMTVIITDHHEVPFEETPNGKDYQIPPADAVVNHKQVDCNYPFKELCGAMVVYQTLMALFESRGENQRKVRELLPYGAMATVCDVMSLVGENRAIVRFGIKQFRELKDLGLKTLIQVCKLDCNQITPYHLGFVLGPNLNASGRLDTAGKAIKLLEEKDPEQAQVLARKIYELNEERKTMTEQYRLQAIREAKEMQDRVLVVYIPECHESIAGIIAGKVRDYFHKPTFILTNGENGVKGSGRSIEEYNMYEALTGVKELLSKFGGHPMAAGVSLEKENVEKFRKRINENCNLSEDDLYLKVWIDTTLPFDYISKELVEELKYLEPFGKGNPKPVFAEKNLQLVHLKIRGKEGNVLSLFVEDEGHRRMPAVIFQRSQEFLAFIVEKFGQEELDKAMAGRKNSIRFMATFYPGINEFQGNQTLQLVIDRFC
ncbi:MAG: single-stranded-DNA-specific exonuclease RecJ [Eubacterium sp.]|nr:single-stranded-DNA-specific exonuclease RecJ [Eubacterium sp.]